eukprot:XP_001694052.1 predicted protein [Chlamydomonas reinhardtii]
MPPGPSLLDLPLSQRQQQRSRRQHPRGHGAAHPPAATHLQRPHPPQEQQQQQPQPQHQQRPQPQQKEPQQGVAHPQHHQQPQHATPAAAPHELEPSPYHQQQQQQHDFFGHGYGEDPIAPGPYQQYQQQQQHQQHQSEPEPEEEQQPGSLGQRLLQWLLRSGALDEAAGPEAQDEEGRLQLPPDRAVSLPVDVMSLITSDPEVGCWLLADMKAAQWAVLDELHAQGLCATACPRIHLRPTHVPMPCQHVPELLAALCNSSCSSASCYSPLGTPSGRAAAAAATPACCYGVVVGASSLGRRPHSRSLVCLHCGGGRQILEDRGLAPAHGAEEEEAAAAQARAPGGRRGPGRGGAGAGPGAWAGMAVCDCGGSTTIHDVQEDLSGRVMVECQELWLGGLRSAGPGSGHFARLGCVRVVLGDGLAGTVRVGDVVQLVGLVRLLGPPGARATAAIGGPGGGGPGCGSGGGSAASLALRSAASAAATAEIEALSISQASPLQAWAPLGVGASGGGGDGGGLIAASGRPLQLLCDVLCRLLGRAVEPLTCLALLASAVSVGGGGSSSSSSNSNGNGDATGEVTAAAPSNKGGVLHLHQHQQHQHQQLCVLLGCERHDPLGPRLLRGAAALLSPLGTWLGGAAAAASAGTATSHLTDDVILPRLQQGSRPDGSADGAAAATVACSALLAAANRGVAVVDADVLSSKQKAQLCETLGRRVLVLAPGRPELSIPVTATVWAAAVRHATAADCDPEASGAPSSRRGGGGGRGPVPGSLRGGWSGLDESCFDMVLGHVAVDDVAGDMALDEGSLDPGDRRPCDRTEAEALTAALRAHVAAAALLAPAPTLSEAGLELLMGYYVAVSQAEVLRALVKVATACARLHLRRQGFVSG